MCVCAVCMQVCVRGCMHACNAYMCLMQFGAVRCAFRPLCVHASMYACKHACVYACDASTRAVMNACDACVYVLHACMYACDVCM